MQLSESLTTRPFLDALESSVSITGEEPEVVFGCDRQEWQTYSRPFSGAIERFQAMSSAMKRSEACRNEEHQIHFVIGIKCQYYTVTVPLSGSDMYGVA